MLQIEGLNTYYGDSHILRGVDVALPSATSMGLLGRNGMGKTTLIRSLMGYVRPASGRVKLDGDDVTGWAPEKMARQGIGYVPEGRGISQFLDEAIEGLAPLIVAELWRVVADIRATACLPA